MRAARILVLPLLLLALAACSAAHGETPRESPVARSSPTPVPPSPSTEGDGDVRVAIVGDSLTAVSYVDFADGHFDPTSWVNDVLVGRYVFAGGWARPGATTTDMLAHVTPLDADVLIVLAGTNDVTHSVSLARSESNLEAIAARVVAACVMVSAIPPLDAHAAAAAAYNESIRPFVRDHGWRWVDPWGALRAGDHYRAGLTNDGIHPTAAGEHLVGAALHADLDAVLATGR